jgi:cell wall assembly regulator SMI1
MEPFADFDFVGFWDSAEYYDQEYTDYPATDELVREVEAELGYRLPEAYVALAKRENGGAPTKSCHRTLEPTSWAKDHVAITGIYSIGRAKRCSLLGEFGRKFWVEEWGYPGVDPVS